MTVQVAFTNPQFSFVIYYRSYYPLIETAHIPATVGKQSTHVFKRIFTIFEETCLFFLLETCKCIAAAASER